MNYKNIFLSFLLATFSITRCNNTEIQIKQLKEDLYKKELELSRLGKEIEEQEQLLESMFDKAANIMAHELHSLTEHEKKEFKGRIALFAKNVDHILTNTKVTNFLMNEFFSNEKADNIKPHRIKSLMIRFIVEKQILKRLFQRFENCLQQVVQLDAELNELEKLILTN
jgi:hypothetical protein